jgi:Arc/MetJ-type ribon-helix-helix transcriptional regulator
LFVARSASAGIGDRLRLESAIAISRVPHLAAGKPDGRIIGAMQGAKAKISITIPRDLLDQIDREADRDPTANRSAVIERWLRRGARSAAAQALREDTVAYYEALSDREREEERAMAEATSRRARRIRYDE